MQRRLFVCLLALAPAGRTRSADWQTLMVQAAAFDRAGRYAEAVAGYRNALRLVEQSSPADAHLPGILNALASATLTKRSVNTAGPCR
jgi:Flp pilus assembly protein TadD